jgi:hypothetical protein
MPSTREIDQVGKREDLSDLIAVADAKETIVTTMLRKGAKPTNTNFDWQVDQYDTPKTSGTVDGTDVASYEDAAKYRARLRGRVQLFRRAPRVTTLAEEVSNVAGTNGSEFDHAKIKKMVEIKRDMETTFLSDQDSQADTGVLPYLTRGLGSWISSTAQTDNPVPSNYLTPASSIFTGALTGFTEDSFSAVLQSRWDQTGTSDELIAVVGSALKRAISNFTRYDGTKASNANVRFFTQEAQAAKLETTVDFYEGDFGDVEIHKSSFVPNTNRGYILDMRMLELRTHTAPYFKQLEDRGGGPNGLIQAIVGLAVLNPLAHAKIVGS